MGSGRGDILADMLSAAKGKQRARDSHVDVTSETPRSPRVAKRRRISDHLKATTTHEFLTELDDPIRDFPESSKAPSSSRCSRNRSGPPGIRAENLNAHLRRRDNQHPGNRSLDNTPYKGKDVRILGSNGRATPVIESLQLTHSTNHHFSTNCDSLDIIRSLEEERDELKAIVKDHRSQLASRPTRAEFESFKKDIEKSFEAKFESRLKDLETKLEKKPVEKKRFAGLPNFQKTSEPLKAVGVSTRSSADAVGELRDHVRKMFDNESSNRFDEWVEALRPLLDATMPKYIQSRAEVLDEQLGERIKELLTGKNSSQFTNLLQPIVAGIMVSPKVLPFTLIVDISFRIKINPSEVGNSQARRRIILDRVRVKVEENFGAAVLIEVEYTLGETIIKDISRIQEDYHLHSTLMSTVTTFGIRLTLTTISIHLSMTAGFLVLRLLKRLSHPMLRLL